jgi:DNA-binding transcriptional ArsR family regulator
VLFGVKKSTFIAEKLLDRIGHLAILPNDMTKSIAAGKEMLSRYESRARIIKAMAHPVRLFMVEELSKGERCVCELTELVGMDTSTVSKHLLVLKNAGIVADEKRGAWVYYRLRVPCVLNFFGCVESVLSEGRKNPSRTSGRQLLPIAKGRRH